MSRLFSGFERLFLGASGLPQPPLILVLMWALFCAARIPGAFFSLGEDDLWALVVAVDGSWKDLLLFDGPFATNHVIYTALSKLLIKAAGHHAVELVYRIPTLVAGALALPLAYAAGTRLGGLRVGILASLLATWIPAMNYQALNARGYMLWAAVVLWILSLLLTPARNHGRLGLAYLLLAGCHGLGPVTLFGLAVLGPWLRPEPPTRREWLRHFLVAVPGLLYAARVTYVMMAFKQVETRYIEGQKHYDTWLYPLNWFEENLASLWLPWASLPFLVLLALGAWRLLRTRPIAGLALLHVGWSVPFLFAVTGEQGGYARFALGGMGAWLLCIAVGAATLRIPRLSDPDPDRGLSAGAWLALIGIGSALWGSRIVRDWTLPLQVDYLGAVRSHAEARPRAKVMHGISREYATGIGYYCRRFGLQYRVLDSDTAAARALAAHGKDFALLWIPQQGWVPASLPPWVRANLVLEKSWPSGEMPVEVYRAP